MKFSKQDLLLYAVTDRHWLGEETLAQQVEKALQGGATLVQLREKELDDRAFLAAAREICAVCRNYQIPFIVNDNVDAALACGADGVHVGQSDLEAGTARKKVGPSMILGVSAQTVEQAVKAEQQGADYLGVGAVFPTGSKDDAEEVSYETLKHICAAVSIPVVAIGGISKDNIARLAGSGICGVSVISAIFAQPDIKAATADLKARTKAALQL